MKLKIFIFQSLFFLILSCKIKKNINQDGIVELIPFFKENYYKYNDRFQGGNSTKVILYSNVRPLKENEKIPEKIYDFFF